MEQKNSTLISMVSGTTIVVKESYLSVIGQIHGGSKFVNLTRVVGGEFDPITINKANIEYVEENT